MPLIAFNITGSTVSLVAGNPAPVLPPSPEPPTRGFVVDVTHELQGLGDAEYDALEAQRPGTVEYEWTGDPEYDLGNLTSGAVSEHIPAAHASTHGTSGADTVNVLNETATNQTTAATNQTAAATNQTTAATNQGATAVNQAAASSLILDPTAAVNQAATAGNQTSPLAHHEYFPTPESAGTTLGQIAESTSVVNPSGQPTHATNLTVTFAAGWDGGDIQVSGTGADGQSVSETFSASPGSTVTGVKAFALIDTPNGISNTAPMAGADVADIKTGQLLGLASNAPATAFKITVDLVNGILEAVDPTNRTVKPDVTGGFGKDGVRTYEVWYTSSHTHVQDAHTHTQDAHSHVVTDGGHTHTQDAHSHTQDVHSHTQDAHNHTQDVHTHTQDAHDHRTS